MCVTSQRAGFKNESLLETHRLPLDNLDKGGAVEPLADFDLRLEAPANLEYYLNTVLCLFTFKVPFFKETLEGFYLESPLVL